MLYIRRLKSSLLDVISEQLVLLHVVEHHLHLLADMVHLLGEILLGDILALLLVLVQLRG